MASVQELLLAAEAKKKINPLVELFQSGIQGFSTGQTLREKNLDIVTKLLQKQQLVQEIEAQKQMQDEINNELGLREKETTSKLNSLTPTSNSPVTSQRFKTKIVQNEKGKFSRTFETIEPKETTYTPREYFDVEKGVKKLGSYDSSTGKLIKTPEDPVTEIVKPVSRSQAQTSIDRVFANEYTDWQIKGGASDTLTQIKTLEGALTKLKTQKNLTGPVVGVQPSLVRKVSNPESVAVQQDVEQSIQKSMKQILGHQFTQVEGENVLKRSFDPVLPETENAKKVQRTLNQLKIMAQAKQKASDYYEENGTLEGYKGTFWTIKDGEIVKGTKDDFYKAMEITPENESPGSMAKKTASQRFDELINQGKKEDEAYKILASEGY